MGIFLILVLALSLTGLGILADYRAFKSRPLPVPGKAGPDQNFLFEIPPGMSLRSLAGDLTAQGVLEHPYYFLVLA